MREEDYALLGMRKCRSCNVTCGCVDYHPTCKSCGALFREMTDSEFAAEEATWD